MNKNLKKSKKVTYKEILLLAIVILIIFIILEVSFRIYYGKNISVASSDQGCFKEYYKNLPTGGNFLNFQRGGYYIDDPVMGVTLKPNLVMDGIFPINNETGNVTGTKVFYNQHHNSAGMRNLQEFSVEKPKNINTRIAMYGDSFTYGHDSYLPLGMCNLLNEIVPNSEVMNFGIPGRGVDTFYLRYVLEGRKYKADIVVVNLYIEDLERPYITCAVDKPNITIEKGKIKIGPRQYPTLQDFYYSYKTPKYESYFVNHALLTINTYREHELYMEKGFKLFDVMLDDIKAKTDEDGSHLIVGLIMQENPPQIIKDYDQKIKMLLDEKKIFYYDSTDYFSQKKPEYKRQSFYYISETMISSHFGPIGNALYAQGLKDKMYSLGWINDSTYYYYANYGIAKPMVLLDNNFTSQKIIYPYGFEAANYSVSLLPKSNRKLFMYNYSNGEIFEQYS